MESWIALKTWFAFGGKVRESFNDEGGKADAEVEVEMQVSKIRERSEKPMMG